jgi:hypothetical protein
MKITRTLIALAAVLPLTLFAQVPAGTGAAPGAAAGAQVAPATSPGAQRLPRVQFEGATLKEIIEYLQAQSKEAGHDPNVDPLNVVISPGLEMHRLPSVSLRNVSPTEVLTIATTVLGLTLEPVTGDSGQTVAWLVRGPAAGNDPFSGGPVSSPPPPLTPGPGEGGGPGIHGFPAGPNPPNVPVAVELAASPPPPVDPTAATSRTPKKSRVFGVASLIASNKEGPEVREEEQARNFARLIDSLQKMAADQGGNAEIKAYREMNILVVRSSDLAVMELIADAIEAMKANASRGTDGAKATEDVLRTEMNALKAQLSIVHAEKDMQRQTLLDQIELLKAARKTDDSPPAKR